MPSLESSTVAHHLHTLDISLHTLNLHSWLSHCLSGNQRTIRLFRISQSNQIENAALVIGYGVICRL